MIAVQTHSVEETRAVAGVLGKMAEAGDVLLLAGDLGAGKTAFAQGYGAALGVESRVTSPTFTLANRYEGRLVLNHLDVYRLEQLNEITELGLYELIDGTSAVLIEWGDAIAPVLPADYLEVRLSLADGDDDRLLTFRPVGPRWAARERWLRDALVPWTGAG